MYKEAGKIIFSPTDLTVFMNSPFASWMQRWEVEDPITAPIKDPESDMTETLSRKGYEHEQNLLDEFKGKKLQIVDIQEELFEDEQHVTFQLKRNATVQAMESGAEVIFQAALESDLFRGYADFLVLTQTPLAGVHYEVWDTKLSSVVKPAHVIQLCCYAEMLLSMRGVMPESFVVALGNGEVARLSIDDYYHYYLALKKNFIHFQESFDVTNMPDPAESKTFGRWESFALENLRSRDHVALVANITRTQVKKLALAGVETVDDLVCAGSKDVPGIQVEIFEKLKKQAILQKQTDGKIPPLFEIKKNSGQNFLGLSILPPHSPLDIFFDIEGYPLEKGGLEYLWGCTYFDDAGKRAFRDFWAHDATQEKEAFRRFILWAYERWVQDPSMHIYHYAHYEIAACRKLMGRYGVCEYELDQLLRNDVFVDLYKVVVQGMVVGEPRYSIKNIEHLYRGKRDTEVESGGDSVVVYEKWQTLFRSGLESDDWKESEILAEIRAYNIDDCDSTQELVDWLRVQQAKNDISYIGATDVIEPEIPGDVSERSVIRERLLGQSKEQSFEQKRVTENLAWVLEFHRREAKPVFWRLFDRLGMAHVDLLDDIDCIAMCSRTEKEPCLPTLRARNLVYEYRFNSDQEFKIPRLEGLYLLEIERRKVKLCKELSDFENGVVAVQAAFDPGKVITLIPDEYICPRAIQEAIDSVVTDYANLDERAFYEKHNAISDYLFRRRPNIADCDGKIVESDNPSSRLKETVSAVERLNKSYLIIQGPPGSGKTYTGKHVIASLVSKGKTVAVSSNSHKAINHLLLGVASCCSEQKIPVSVYATKDTGGELGEAGIEIVKSRELSSKVGAGVVIGGTAWGICQADLEKQFDYLFIDEAGQVPMARLVGMSRAADNLVLMGDQMQLSQPSQGVHPVDSGLSVLDYALGQSPIVDDEMGVFLGTSYRMHSEVNRFVSQAFYAGMLQSDPQNDVQEVLLADFDPDVPLLSAGIQFVPVEHQGCQQASDEEAQTICELAEILMSGQFRDKEGAVRSITIDDMLFLAPYNQQVNSLQAYLGVNAKVGTVDKFQGQEAPIVFYSLCSSEPSESSRGLEFLYDRNRMNVALSRGQCLVVVVGSPALACPGVSTLDQMFLANTMSKLIFSGSSSK